MTIGLQKAGLFLFYYHPAIICTSISTTPLCPPPPHRHTQQLADQHLVIAVVLFPVFAFARLHARDLVFWPAVDLALFIAEPRLVAGTAKKLPRRSSFGLAGEAGRNRHRGRARVVF